MVLRLNLPLLNPLSHDYSSALKDTPGFFEADKAVTKVAELSLESSCVYLFVIKYDQLPDAGDDKILQALCSSDKCK